MLIVVRFQYGTKIVGFKIATSLQEFVTRHLVGVSTNIEQQLLIETLYYVLALLLDIIVIGVNVDYLSRDFASASNFSSKAKSFLAISVF